MNVGKCIIQPLYFRERNEREQKEYDEQMKNISALYEDEAEFLPEKMLGAGTGRCGCFSANDWCGISER